MIGGASHADDVTSLIGRWKKVTEDACAAAYPDELEFFEATYQGRKGPGQRAIVWDAGIYRVLGPAEVEISTWTDALVVYRFSHEGGRLEFTDDAGCNFRYVR